MTGSDWECLGGHTKGNWDVLGATGIVLRVTGTMLGATGRNWNHAGNNWVHARIMLWVTGIILGDTSVRKLKTFIVKLRIDTTVKQQQFINSFAKMGVLFKRLFLFIPYS